MGDLWGVMGQIFEMGPLKRGHRRAPRWDPNVAVQPGGSGAPQARLEGPCRRPRRVGKAIQPIGKY